MASWIRSPNFSPMCRNSGVGTRTKITFELVWLKRVGFSHVSNEWRLIFFSRAERIRSHGFAVAVTVAVDKDMLKFFSCCEPARGPRIENRSCVLYMGDTEQLKLLQQQKNSIDWRAY